MGQARQKMAIRVDMAKMTKERAEYAKTVPMRLLKGVSGFLLFIPFTMVCFAWESFRQNQWPWNLR